VPDCADHRTELTPGGKSNHEDPGCKNRYRFAPFNVIDLRNESNTSVSPALIVPMVRSVLVPCNVIRTFSAGPVTVNVHGAGKVPTLWTSDPPDPVPAPPKSRSNSASNNKPGPPTTCNGADTTDADES
jgi:hypothetical protein